jgi:hypothetical protein
VEEQCIFQITISMISNTYIMFLLMLIQSQSLSHLVSLDNKWHTSSCLSLDFKELIDVPQQREITKFLIGIVLYTNVITYTSLLPTPLECRYEVLLDSSWVNVLFQNYFGHCQVCIKMCLGPT